MYTIIVHGTEIQHYRGGSVAVEMRSTPAAFDSLSDACKMATSLIRDNAALLLHNANPNQVISNVTPTHVEVKSETAVVAHLVYQISRFSIPELDVPFALRCIKRPFASARKAGQSSPFEWHDELYATKLVTDSNAEFVTEEPVGD